MYPGSIQWQMKLIRHLLEFAEQHESDYGMLPPELPGHTDRQRHYHVKLCEEAGYVDIRKIPNAADPYARYYLGDLTWQRHEALKAWRGGQDYLQD